MKILIAGDWHSELHEEAVFNAFKQLGHEPLKFAWHHYFASKGWAKRITSLFHRAQNKYMFGPAVSKLNRDLYDFARKVEPDVIFIYRGTHIYAKTVDKLKHALKQVQIIGYNNDDPFSPQYPRWKWRHFLGSVPKYDMTLAYRKHNIDEYLAIGAKRVELLRSWFIPERNFPAQLSEKEKEQYECDVVFVGHYEDDGRLEYLEEVVRRGWRLRIFGPGYEWDPILRRSSLLAGHVPVRLVWGRDYNNALCGAKVALCFFSQLNRDTYTRRCFEIPASGTLLMSKYTDDMAGLYVNNHEALFFQSIEEMQAGLDVVLGDEKKRDEMAKAGANRVWDDGHDVISRMQKLLGWLDESKGRLG